MVLENHTFQRGVMKKYWVDSKEDLNKIEKLLKENEISYEVKIEKMKISLRYHIHQKRKKIYVILINSELEDIVDEILVSQTEVMTETCYSKKIQFAQEKKKKNLKEIILSIIVCIVGVAFFVWPIGEVQNNMISAILVITKIILVIIMAIVTAKRNAVSVLFLLTLEFLAIMIGSYIFFVKYALNIINIFSFWSQHHMFILIMLMVITLFIGVFFGLRNYQNDTLKDKISYVTLIVVGYLIIMVATIVGYANLINNYHSELYFKYEDILMDANFTINEESKICIKTIEKETENGHLEITGYYNKEIGSTIEDMNPYSIRINVYKDNDFSNFYIIEPPINTVLESDPISNWNIDEYFYFSCITYFTIGYGDIYPIADVVKYWVIEEAFISHIMSLLIVPILILIGQTFVNKNEKIE